MINGNDPAMPLVSDGYTYPGLTKREHFASSATDITEDDYTLNKCIEIMGSEPPTDTIENIKWWFSLKAKLRLMYADVLITELNKPQP